VYPEIMQIVVEELEPPMAIQWAHRMTDDEYFQFCAANKDLRIERTAEGDIVIMPPVGGEGSYQNSELSGELRSWARKDGRGRSLDSSVEYLLPSGAAYSPDASWVSRSRLDKLSKDEKRKFLPLCPDFVVELKSPSDRLAKLKRKMLEWIENGAQLGWLLDPDHRTVYIYRPGCEPEQIVNPERAAGEGPVDGFVLELADIWAGL
jgi:Uma2 family endonuclease